MTSIMIFALTSTGSLMLIIALLLVAGIIGYLTAWFYAKSIYTPIIKKLETEKENLISRVKDLEADKEMLLNRIAGLNDDIGRLNLRITSLLEKIGGLEGELAKKDVELTKYKKVVS